MFAGYDKDGSGQLDEAESFMSLEDMVRPGARARPRRLNICTRCARWNACSEVDPCAANGRAELRPPRRGALRAVGPGRHTARLAAGDPAGGRHIGGGVRPVRRRRARGVRLNRNPDHESGPNPNPYPKRLSSSTRNCGQRHTTHCEDAPCRPHVRPLLSALTRVCLPPGAASL
eukprot:5084769-Prymnesium_polylepis.2